MAKRRMIDTRFWSDNFIADLNPLDRYLFLYFLTNEHTNISGIYEVPLKRVSDETGIEKEMLLKMLKRLKGKITYVEGWVGIKNFSKYQSDNESVRMGVENAKKLIPSHILQSISRVWEGGDTLGGESDISELESELKLEPKAEQSSAGNSSSKDIEEIIVLFKEVNPLYSNFFSNRTERGAILSMISSIGFDKLKATVQHLPDITSQKYAPKITKPTELKRDFGKLIAFVKQGRAPIKNNVAFK